jgi:hypothetical protein
VRRAFRLLPCSDKTIPCRYLPGDRNDLLAGENAEQSYQGDQRRCRRAYVEKTLDHPDEETGTESQKIDLRKAS